jgi:hypothetical protein
MAFQWEWVALHDVGDEWVTVRRHPRLPEIEWPNGELEAAARALARSVQAELHAAEVLERGRAIELDARRHLYLLAFLQLALYRTGKRTWRIAKEAEADAAPGRRPLAICLGTWGASGVYVKPGTGRETLVTVISRSGKVDRVRLGPYGGCLRTFPDAPFSRGNCWPTWCEMCEDGKSNAKDAAVTRIRDEWSSLA